MVTRTHTLGVDQQTCTVHTWSKVRPHTLGVDQQTSAKFTLGVKSTYEQKQECTGGRSAGLCGKIKCTTDFRKPPAGQQASSCLEDGGSVSVQHPRTPVSTRMCRSGDVRTRLLGAGQVHSCSSWVKRRRGTRTGKFPKNLDTFSHNYHFDFLSGKYLDKISHVLDKSLRTGQLAFRK